LFYKKKNENIDLFVFIILLKSCINIEGRMVP